MADNQKIREEVQALTDRLETGIQDLYSSDKYAAYLDTLAKFHNYSTRNTMLIHLQIYLYFYQSAFVGAIIAGMFDQEHAIEILREYLLDDSEFINIWTNDWKGFAVGVC